MASASSRPRPSLATPFLALSILAAHASCARPSAPRPEPSGAPPAQREWMASWAASPKPGGREPVVFHGQTLREVVHLSAGGDSIRLHLSNAYGKTPLEVTSVHVASS